MALFSECRTQCAQTVLDTADIVRDGDVSPTIHNVGVTCRLEPLRSAHLCLWTQAAAPRSTAGSVNSKRSPCFVPCKTRSSPKNGRYTKLLPRSARIRTRISDAGVGTATLCGTSPPKLARKMCGFP